MATAAASRLVAHAALRAGVGVESSTLVDQVTRRQFPLDAAQLAVVELLDGSRSPVAIARAIFEDETEAEAVERFIERLNGLGLLESEVSRTPAELGALQAAALRPAARRRRDQRIRDSVRWAAEQLPFYREHIGERASSVEGISDLVDLPLTDKANIRANFPAGLLPEGLDLDDLIERGEAQLSTTSGSTGGRLATVRDNARDVVSERFPGVRSVPGGWESVRIARFTTPLCTGAVCHRGDVPFTERIVNQTLHLHSSDRVLRMRRKEVETTLADLERFEANVLQVDPVYAVALVRSMERFELTVPKVSAVLSFFEYLSLLHREILEDAFGAPVTDFLSAADLGGGVAAFECPNHRMHVNEHENAFEIVRNGRPAEPGEIGEILVTSLNHRFTRLIRYRLGDLARPVERCGCEFDDLTAFEFEGRIQDSLVDTAGHPVTTRAVDQLFDGLRWVDFYQFVQRSSTGYQLLAIRRPGVDEGGDPGRFVDRARGVFGADAEIDVEHTRDLPIEPSYKYPMTKQAVPSLLDYDRFIAAR